MRTLVATMLLLGVTISPALAQDPHSHTTLGQLMELTQREQYLFIRGTLETYLMDNSGQFALGTDRGPGWGDCLKGLANDTELWFNYIEDTAVPAPSMPVVMFVAVKVEASCMHTLVD